MPRKFCKICHFVQDIGKRDEEGKGMRKKNGKIFLVAKANMKEEYSWIKIDIIGTQIVAKEKGVREIGNLGNVTQLYHF